MKKADTRKLKASIRNDGVVPNCPVTSPPMAAPSESITLQVAELSALAAPISDGVVISGRMALRAGKKMPLPLPKPAIPEEPKKDVAKKEEPKKEEPKKNDEKGKSEAKAETAKNPKAELQKKAAPRTQAQPAKSQPKLPGT